MSIFAGAIDDLFADPNLTREAVWRAGGSGVPVTVRIVVRRPDRVSDFGETRLHSETTVIDIRVTDAPQLANGDAFEIDGDAFVVQGEPLRDAERLIWTAEVIRA
jgi:hypothetical protein